METYLRYQAHLPFAVPRSERGHVGAALPQHYADEFEWDEMAAATSIVFHSLTTEEQAKTAIFANNYGEAGAIDFFGPRYGLPKAISGHQTYFYWGPRSGGRIDESICGALGTAADFAVPRIEGEFAGLLAKRETLGLALRSGQKKEAAGLVQSSMHAHHTRVASSRRRIGGLCYWDVAEAGRITRLRCCATIHNLALPMITHRS